MKPPSKQPLADEKAGLTSAAKMTAEGREAWRTLNDKGEEWRNARQVMEAGKPTASDEVKCEALPCHEEPPDTPNVFPDGSFANPQWQVVALGSFGVSSMALFGCRKRQNHGDYKEMGTYGNCSMMQ